MAVFAPDRDSSSILQKPLLHHAQAVGARPSPPQKKKSLRSLSDDLITEATPDIILHITPSKTNLGPFFPNRAVSSLEWSLRTGRPSTLNLRHTIMYQLIIGRI